MSGISLLSRLFFMMVFALSISCLWIPAQVMAAQADEAGLTQDGKVLNPATDLWRAVRQREGMSPMADTPTKGMDSEILINIKGEDWRRFRMEQLIPKAGMLIGGVIGLILIFHLIKGGLEIEGGRSGKYLLRFREFDRVLHWTVALIFIFLALTGLILLGGRSLLIPLIGHEAFSVIASASKEGHNLFGPLFIVGVIALFVRFISKNFLGKGDIGWLLRAGGMFGGKHPTAGFFNMGEKIWFWMLIIVGLIVSATGLILEFSFLGGDRELMELAMVLHGVGATLLIVGAFGHIYMGVAGMKGSLESMTTGYVDLNWARQHHDQWAAQCEQEGNVLDKKPGVSAEGKAEPVTDSPVSTR